MTQTYNVYRHSGVRAEYIGADSSDVQKRHAIVTSTPPKSATTNPGTRRSSINLVRAVSVPKSACGEATDCVQMDAKFSLETSLPVGMPDAELDSFIEQMSALFAQPILLKDMIRTGKIVNTVITL